MKLIKAFNIEWVTNGEEIDLPKEAFFSVDNNFNIEEGLEELLSGEYNYLVNIAEYEIVAETHEQSFLVT
jgi:hypothetical protein